jgi:hypothetical protein
MAIFRNVSFDEKLGWRNGRVASDFASGTSGKE